jgi:ankyrin repeat protein
LDAGADPNARLFEKSSPPLEYAAVCGLEAVVDRLLEAGADPTLRNGWNSILAGVHSRLMGYGETGIKDRIVARLRKAVREASGPLALIENARAGELDRVKALLAAGVGVDAEGDWSETALLAAAESGHVDVVRHLILAGADLNHSNAFRTTPLHKAAIGEHLEVLRLLLVAGANVGVTSALLGAGSTALSGAVWRGQGEVVKVFLAAEVPIDPVALAESAAKADLKDAPPNRRMLIDVLIRRGQRQINQAGKT